MHDTFFTPQTGKTTLIRQVMESLKIERHYASADEPTLQSRARIEQQWALGRLLAREAGNKAGALLVLDKIQKVVGCSETVKRLWEADTAKKVPRKVVLLGSAPLLIQRGVKVVSSVYPHTSIDLPVQAILQ
jgi:predicted AAA+ superfamily ATPase